MNIPQDRAILIDSTFRKFGSDKAEHGYSNMYASFLPENPKCIIEIGVKEGSSLRAWRHLFPGALIIGVDLFDEYPQDPYMVEQPAWLFKGHQCSYSLLEDLRKFNADVIIDDGSHNARDQMITFFGLAHPGCHYFIEDCFTEEFYSQGLPQSFNAHNLFRSLEEYTDERWRKTFDNYVHSVGEITYIKC